jgi:hypothetical protein
MCRAGGFVVLIGSFVVACAGSGGSGTDSGAATADSALVADRAPLADTAPTTTSVVFTIDSTSNVHPISRYIYGTNDYKLPASAKNLTLTRVGGNRLSAYNWETNASNAGSDWKYSSDNYMSPSSEPALPFKQAAQTASDASASIILTVPAAGWVAADENGACEPKPTPEQIAQHFLPTLPQKGAAFAYPPDLTDGKVYADELVAYLESQFPAAQTDPLRRIFYMIDNEPDLWSQTHSEMHPTPATYAEVAKINADFATGIKNVAPSALVFGPVNYGWQGMVNLQKATDANGRDFLEFFLDAMKAAEPTAGKRLLDALDVHWYPEATGGGKRITDNGLAEDEVQARLQAPRSLWDTTYTETSWITQSSTKAPIRLIPRLKAKIDQHYPGTKLSISEYNSGARNYISGGIAESDVLGIFGREDVFAATVWMMNSTNTFIYGGFAMYRNYDGNGASFGDTSVAASTTSIDTSSIYASVSSTDPTKVVAVAINKAANPTSATITVNHPTQLAAADVYVLTSASATPAKGAAITANGANTFSYTMPARSVTTLSFR